MTPIKTEVAANMCGKAAGSFNSERCRKSPNHPPFYKVGRTVFYYREEVERFIASRRVCR